MKWTIQTDSKERKKVYVCCVCGECLFLPRCRLARHSCQGRGPPHLYASGDHGAILLRRFLSLQVARREQGDQCLAVKDGKSMDVSLKDAEGRVLPLTKISPSRKDNSDSSSPWHSKRALACRTWAMPLSRCVSRQSRWFAASKGEMSG